MANRNPTHPRKPERRSFLLGLGATAAALPTLQTHHSPSSSLASSLPNLLRLPDRISAFSESNTGEILLARSGIAWQGPGVEVVTEIRDGKAGAEVALFLIAPKIPLRKIRVRWHGAFPSASRYLGDHWERSYGDLEFRGLAGDRLMPWYFLATDRQFTQASGVKTGAASICYWQVDAAGVTLWLDVSNGGSGVLLGDRRLLAATLIQRTARSADSIFDLARTFCHAMCDRPLLSAQPIYGSNNWYYMYGNNTSAERSLQDAALLAELVPFTIKNRPFCVIDMGWHAAPEGAGPSAQTSQAYPDMRDLASKMQALNVRPGIWTRPTLTSEAKAQSWRLPPAGGRSKGDLIALDPTIPEARNYISENIAILRDWGYELIKFDFSTFDLFGRWGFEFGPTFTDEGWHFFDRSRTNAEIVTDLYRAIRQAAGSAALIGCNTIGHLAAGLVEAQRIGDDTSGREWSRTRKMGVNTLAFRLPQHNTFFAADADCVPVTPEIPREFTSQWLDLVAHSGTALFVSVDPSIVQRHQRQELSSALFAASQKREPGIPLDWQDTTTPEHWKFDGKPVQYDWYKSD